jgi:hypothetical protein
VQRRARRGEESLRRGGCVAGVGATIGFIAWGGGKTEAAAAEGGIE